MTEYVSFFDEQFWVAFSFVVFLLLTVKPLKKMIISFLDERAAKITEDLSNAEKSLDEAKKNFQQVKLKHEQTNKESEQILQKAKVEAVRIVEEFRNKADEICAQKEIIASQKILSYEALAKEHLRIEAIETATEVVKEIIKDNLDSETSARIIDSSIHSMIGSKKL